MPGSSEKDEAKPAWLAPVVIILLVGTLIAIGQKKEEAIENPLIDYAILTIGVFAFAALFRVFGSKLGSPGLAAFFGAAPVQHDVAN